MLYQGQRVLSDNGRYFLIMQTDGNLVMYRNDGAVRFATYRFGHREVMQGDGQFVEYTAQAINHSGSQGPPVITTLFWQCRMTATWLSIAAPVGHFGQSAAIRPRATLGMRVM